MKKLSLTVKSLLLLAVAAGVASCGDKAATTPAQTPAATPAEETAKAVINIRYIDIDSVLSSYTLAQQLMEEQQREMLKLQQWHNSKQQELQNLANQINQKQQNNIYLTQESMQGDINNLQKKSEEAERYMNTQQQRLANADMQIRARLSDSIHSVVSEFNATRGYDAILTRNAGIYFNPALNITAEIIESLNARANVGTDKKK